jgi:hypothetical protein
MTNETPDWLTSPALTALRTHVFRRVGKSIYLYQEIEKRIKFLNVALNLELSGTSQEGWSEQLAKQQDALSVKTMGTLMRSLLEKLYFSSEDQTEVQPLSNPTSNELIMRRRFSLQTTAAYIHERKQMIEAFVEDRNHLVHHFFESVNFANVVMLEQMAKDLDTQHQKIDDEIKHLNQIIKLLNESSNAESEWWNSEEGTKQLDIIRLQNSTPIHFLEWHPASNADPNGWSVFQSACTELKNKHQIEVERFFNSFPYKSLQAAAIASGLFEFLEEATPKGQRLLYRLKAADYEYTTTFHSPI